MSRHVVFLCVKQKAHMCTCFLVLLFSIIFTTCGGCKDRWLGLQSSPLWYIVGKRGNKTIAFASKFFIDPKPPLKEKIKLRDCWLAYSSNSTPGLSFTANDRSNQKIELGFWQLKPFSSNAINGISAWNTFKQRKSGEHFLFWNKDEHRDLIEAHPFNFNA